MKPIIIFFFIWLLFALIGYGVGVWAFNPAALEQFTNKGIGLYGKVIAKEPENHATIRYSYSVDGKQYAGTGSAGRGNPNFDQIQIGQEMIVFYDPDIPEKSILGYPQLYSKANYLGVLFSSIFFPFFPMIVIYAIYQIVRHRNRSQ